jgi:hypothetical protein
MIRALARHLVSEISSDSAAGTRAESQSSNDDGTAPWTA